MSRLLLVLKPSHRPDALASIRCARYHIFMNLILVKFIDKQLIRAKYEYDDSVDQWAAWIDGFTGVYAQAPTIEEARDDLASAIEEHILISIRNGENIRGISMPRVPDRAYAKAR